MSTTVTYKGNTLTTVNNATKTLKTAGKYMEGDVVLTDTTADPTVGPITVTPEAESQIITATSQELDYITQVTINAIPYTESDNSAGGITVTIGNVA